MAEFGDFGKAQFTNETTLPDAFGGDVSFDDEPVDFGGDTAFDTTEFGDFATSSAGRDDRLARGVDLLEATTGSGIQAFGEIFGFDAAVEAGKEIKERNRREADEQAEASQNILEGLVESLPTIGGVATGALVGAGVGSIIPIIGTGVGQFPCVGVYAVVGVRGPVRIGDPVVLN